MFAVFVGLIWWGFTAYAGLAGVDNNAFSGTVDLSGVGDGGSLAITANGSDAAGNAAEPFAGNFVKDMVAPSINTVSVSDDNIVNAADDLSAVVFSGTTSGIEDGQEITLDIGGVTATTTCFRVPVRGCCSILGCDLTNEVAIRFGTASTIWYGRESTGMRFFVEMLESVAGRYYVR